MKKRLLCILLVLCMALALAPSAAMAGAPTVTISKKYEFKGTIDQWWCEESYWPSPVVTDLDGDGKLEVINAAYTLYVMDAATGDLKWRVNTTKDRNTPFSVENNFGDGKVYCDFKVLDIDADGKKEIVIAYGNGTVSVLDSNGYFKSGWPQKPTSAGIYSLAVADLNGDRKMEIIVGAGVASAESVWVYDCYGKICPGWPQLDSSKDGSKNPDTAAYKSKTAYSYGVFSNSITTGDLNGDGRPEIIVPTDNQYINAYYYDGSLVKASSIYSDSDGSRMWGKIGLFEDYAQEKAHPNEGWGYGPEWGGLKNRADKYRAEFGHAAAVYTDVDGDGKSEVVVSALMMDRTTYANYGNNVQNISDSRYMTVYILNQDRSRYENKTLGFDWTTAPNELTHPGRIGGPLKSSDPISLTGEVLSVPVCEDLNGDGYKEILFNSYDGKVHCFTLDQKGWSYKLPKTTSTVFEFATPVVCKDLDGDGEKEVIFASWTGNNGKNGATGVKGALYVLSSEGKLLASMDLPDAYNAAYTNGVWAAPTVEDIDGDGTYEVLLNTQYYALCAYKLTAKSTSTPTPTPTPTPSFKIELSAQNLTVDAKENVACEKYNIDGNNYFKLRDLAQLLSGTGSQFEVVYDAASKKINVTTGKAYTPDGSELVLRGDMSSKAEVSAQTLWINGVKHDELKVYNISGNNFFQLRQLGDVLGFDVGYNDATKTAIVRSK